MQVSVENSNLDARRLYLTYRNRPENYQKVKLMFTGDEQREKFRRSLRGRLIFLGATAFIAAASSGFSYFTEHYDSLVAIWMIWIGNVIVFGIWLYLDYRFSLRVYEGNLAFFERFEACAQAESDVDAFQTCFEQT